MNSRGRLFSELKIKASSRNSKSVSRLSYVRRRCTTWDNRGCRQSRNPRTGPPKPGAAKRRRFVPEIPAAQWNELRALFVDKSQEIRFCENTQLIPLRRRHANRALPVILRRLFLWIIRGFRLRLHPRLSHVVHLRRTHSDEQGGRKLETKSKKGISRGSLKGKIE